MNDEAFSAFLSESSASQLPIKLNTQKSYVPLENKSIQTESSREVSPTGESHPILGELIQRQNGEISKLKQEKSELRKDIQTLLSCVLTMQKLAKISSKGAICPPVPPQVTDIASKYVIGGVNYFSSVMENGWNSNEGGERHQQSSSSARECYARESSLKEVDDEYDDKTEDSSFFSYASTRTTKLSSGFSARGSIEDRSSSHGIPSLDKYNDDNISDHHSHQNSTTSSSSSSSAMSKISSSTENGADKPTSHNNNGLNGNKISTILM